MARGRKRKSGKRHPCGKLVRPSSGETQAEILATVVDARRRQYGVTARQARDDRLGSALGRLAFAGLITAEQYQAGSTFGEVYHRHHLVTGMPLPTPRSVGGLMAGGGIIGGCTSQPDDEVVERVRRRYDAALKVLAQCDRDRRALPGQPPGRLVHRLVCLDEDAPDLTEHDREGLCHALDELGVLFGQSRERSRKLL